MGQKGYERSIKDWIREGRLSEDDVLSTADNSNVTQASVKSRATLWRLAHERRTADGNWGVDPSRAPETARVVQRIVSILSFLFN